MMIIIIMLMSTIRLDLQLPACVTIHNQCSNIKLVSPVYFGNSVVCSKLSDQQISIGTIMRNYFEIETTQDRPEGTLLYKLQRYSDSPHNMNTLITENNEAKCIQMLVVWKVKDPEPFAHVILVEHTKEFIWNEDELKKLYNKNCGWFEAYDSTTSYTWLVDDNLTLKTSLKVSGLKERFRTHYIVKMRENFELSIFISEEERDEHAMRPLCVDLER
jgi:hypothetical protein